MSFMIPMKLLHQENRRWKNILQADFGEGCGEEEAKMTMDNSHPYFKQPALPVEPWEERGEEVESRREPKTAADLQRQKLEKLLRNPGKTVPIPAARKEWQPPKPPEFVRNVVGSSAGAGSGEYHIYRNLRRKEYARRDFDAKLSKQELADAEWEQRFHEHKADAEERTAKKRAKRMKKKEAAKRRRLAAKAGQPTPHSSDEDSPSDEDDQQKRTSDRPKEQHTESRPKLDQQEKELAS